MTEIRTYRGHIRNWKALVSELGIEGAEKLSRQEREPLILEKAYEKWGHEMGLHMHGMFALALWDADRNELFCLRDPFGTKPFYYCLAENGKLLYGTMIRDILADPAYHRELNEDMLQIYLSLTYGAGEDTFFKGIKKLMPGRYLVEKDGQITITRYFTPAFAPDESRGLQDWADEIHETLKNIMTEVKDPDEEADSFLSGGVDSSYVLAMSDAKMTDSVG